MLRHSRDVRRRWLSARCGVDSGVEPTPVARQIRDVYPLRPPEAFRWRGSNLPDDDTSSHLLQLLASVATILGPSRFKCAQTTAIDILGIPSNCPNKTSAHPKTHVRYQFELQIFIKSFPSPMQLLENATSAPQDSLRKYTIHSPAIAKNIEDNKSDCHFQTQIRPEFTQTPPSQSIFPHCTLYF